MHVGTRKRSLNVIIYTDNKAYWSPKGYSPGPNDLESGDWVVVQMLKGHVPADARITEVQFYGDEDEKQLQGTWKADGSSSYAAFEVEQFDSPSTTSAIKIKDNETLGKGESSEHWFKVYFAGTGGPWVLDPELINRGGG